MLMPYIILLSYFEGQILSYDNVGAINFSSINLIIPGHWSQLCDDFAICIHLIFQIIMHMVLSGNTFKKGEYHK